jgi:hypothetical protein
MPNHSTPKSWRGRVGLAFLALTVAALAGVTLAQGDGWLTRLAQPRQKPPRHDPPLGTDVSGALGVRGLRSEERVLVLFVGECTSCSLNAFEPRKLRHPGFRRVVFLTSSRAEELSASFRSRPGWSVVGAPRSFPALTALAADFAVRAYVLDAKGKLLWYGSRPTEMPEGASYGP